MYTQLVMFYNKSSGMDGFSVKEGWKSAESGHLFCYSLSLQYCSILMKIRSQSHRLSYVLVTIWQQKTTCDSFSC